MTEYDQLLDDMKQIGIYETVMQVVEEHRLERHIKLLDSMKLDLQFRLDKLRKKEV